jgi:zinc protease
MLMKGTASCSALQIDDQQAYLGVSINVGSGWEQSTISLHAPIVQLDSAMTLLVDITLHPVFPATDLERVRKARLTALQQQRDRGLTIADRVYAVALYSSDNSYDRLLAGTEVSIAALMRDDLVKFYSMFYRSNNTILLVVGDVKPDDTKRRVQALFNSWARGDVSSVTVAKAPGANTMTLVLVDKPGAAQSSFRLGGIGAPRSTKDFFALQGMNTLLGGSFASRLMQNLREKHGNEYGASSGFSYRRSAGSFAASAEVVTAKIDSALIEFVQELKSIRDTVPSNEVERAKRFLQLSLPQGFETMHGIVDQLLPLVAYDIPLDFYNTAVQRIRAVMQADVQRVARQYIDPNKLTVVIVGDRKVIGPGLRAFNPGNIVIRDTRDVLGALRLPSLNKRGEYGVAGHMGLPPRFTSITGIHC